MTLPELFTALDGAMAEAQQLAADAGKVKAETDADIESARKTCERAVARAQEKAAAASLAAAHATEKARTLQQEFAMRTQSLLDNVGRVRVS